MNKFKTILAILLTLFQILSLSACGGNDSTEPMSQERQSSEERDSSADANAPADNSANANNFEAADPVEEIVETPTSTADWDRAVNPPADLDAATKDDFTYKYDSDLNGIVITKYNGNETSVLIPETIEDEPVIRLDKDTFVGNKTLEYVYFPNNLQEIHGDAFKNCSVLTLVIPENIELTNIESHFNPSVRNFVLSDNMLGLNNSTYLSFFQELVKNVSVETIKYDDKEYILDSNQTSILSELYNAVTGSDYTSDIEVAEIWDYQYVDFPYYDVNGIAITKYIANNSDIKITIPSEIEGTPVVCIGTWGERPSANQLIFSSTDIIEINIPETVNIIGNYAFRNMQNLKSIELPNNLKVIGNESFSGCSALTSVELPQNLKHIGRAFMSTPNIEEIIIPNSVESISHDIFRGVGNSFVFTIEISNYDLANYDFVNTVFVYRDTKYTNAHELFLAMEPYFSDSLKEDIENIRQNAR